MYPLRGLLATTILTLLACLTSTCFAEAKAPLIIHVKQRELTTNTQPLDETFVLKLALEKTKSEYGDYEIKQIPPMNRARSLFALSNNLYPNLIMQISFDDEIGANSAFRFINFPVDYGTNSYRICFSRTTINTELSNIKDINALRQYTFGTGIGWLDTKILRANGLKVDEQASTINIFKMAQAGHIDLYCRGLAEFQMEATSQADIIGLTSNKSFALYYPLPKFFFAHKNNQALLNRIEKGLIIAYQDGSLKAFWDTKYLTAIQNATLTQRTIIKLENPFIGNLDSEYRKYSFNP
jgi:hypothetical protein